ncbi:MAG TPA: (2Fe-2S)-binding protein [Gemmatimonadaceae bacterium]|nr:(2Fe-2S)-binding protein [Gemmatimonadaceae bacterium]
MRLSVNGRAYDVDAPPHHTLLEVLRDRLALTGTKLVCDRGECGACTVLLDGVPAYACLTLAVACEDDEITTVEGLADFGAVAAARGGRALHPLQAAFIRHDAVQCGFCTPGQLLAGAALLERTTSPDDDEILAAMSGNLCRCGTYPKIVAAIRSAARELSSAAAAAADERRDG